MNKAIKTEDNYTEIMSEERMIEMIEEFCIERKFDQALSAMNFAREKHEGQFRKITHDGKHVRYINHPLIMTYHAMALDLNEDALLAACLLHDVCEDCGVAVEELPVGNDAREAVRLLTKPEDYDHTETSTRIYYNAIKENRIASMVKVLDRCNNVSTMASSFSDEKIAEYIKETEKFVNPLLELIENDYPEYSKAAVLIRYHMSSVLDSLRYQISKRI